MTDVKRRGGHKTAVARLITNIEGLLQATSLEVNDLQGSVTTLKEQKSKILDYDDRIQDTLSDQELEDDVLAASDLQCKINCCISKADNAIQAVLSASNVKVGGSTPKHPQAIKLPVLQLPTFSGNPLDWQHFWDIFKSSVHDRTDLAGSQKFNYLNGQLKGDAIKLLEGFAPTDIHYQAAVNLLTNTFGDKRIIIRSHIHALLDLKCGGAKAEFVSTFRAEFECHIRGLEALGTKVKEAGFVVVELLLRKLPDKIRDNINRTAKSHYWELDDFRSAIDTEIKLLQSASSEDSSHKNKPDTNTSNKTNNKFEKSNGKSGKSRNNSTVSNFNVTATKGNSKFKGKKEGYKCKLCFDTHPFKETCTNYTSTQDRLDRVKELKVCKRCFSSSHGTNPCNMVWPCGFCKDDDHHIIFCPKLVNTKSATVSSATLNNSGNIGVALPTATISVLINNHTYRIRALFDQGAQRSFLLKTVADQLQLRKVDRVQLNIQGFNTGSKQQNYDIVKFVVKTQSGNCTIEALLTDVLPKNIHMPGLSDTVASLKHLGLFLADPHITCDVVSDVSLLIGADQYYNFVQDHTLYNDTHILKSTVGNMITGVLHTSQKIKKNNKIQAGIITILHTHVWDREPWFDDSINLESLWSLDTIGISETCSTSDEEQAILEFEKNLMYKNNKYTASLPWRPDHPELPSNYGIAKGQLLGTIKRLEGKQNHIQIYDSIIKEQLDRGFIERVDPNDKVTPGAKIHYLSHHGVRKDSVTTPLRIVFDCSAGRPSLNDCLFSGPSLIPELAQVLLRFRTNKFACVGDIAKAFLMINLHERDKDSTRFLWPIDPFNRESNLQIFRFRVVLFGATCSPFLLNATIKHHLKKNKTEFTEVMSRNLYVDNLQGTSNSEKEMVQYYHQAKEVFGKAGLVLREWTSNSKLLCSVIKKENDGIEDSLNFVKVLGLKWKFESDRLSYPDREVIVKQYTKREVLRSTAHLFDPLGFLLPVTIRSRIFMQTLWKSKLDWDVEFCVEFQSEWDSISRDLNSILRFEIPRQAVFNQSVEIHAFSDASTKAYGSVLYFVSNGQSNLIMSKARVAPIKSITVPQLELTAAVTSARLVAYVKNTFQDDLCFKTINMWTDSQVVLRWLQSSKPLKPYVRNRVDEIHKLIPNVKWRYVPTKDNPSDYVSRGIKASVFEKSEFWLHGPEWLIEPNDWPTWEAGDVEGSEGDVLAGYAVNNAESHKEVSESVINVARYGSLKKLYKVTMLVFRFLNLLKKRSTLKSVSKNYHKFETDEWEQSEIFWIKEVQRIGFPREFKQLYSTTKIPHKVNLINQLGLFLDNGIIRCQGRLSNSDLEYDSKYPVLIPNKHELSLLIIRHEHERVCHQGVNYVVNLVRQKYWIPQLRSLVKSVISKCVICKKLHGLHFMNPPSPPLPSNRIAEARPFSVIGIDYTGALNVRFGKEVTKVYVALFTCALTRAVHLELVHSNSVNDFLRAFRRFVGRRSLPAKIYSDNASCFVSASKHLKTLQEHPEIQSQFQNIKTNWFFIPARAPWYGGFWERMIGIVKSNIKKCLGLSLVSEDELRTILTEVESIVNDRPLTYVSDNLEDLTSLTPSELVFGYKLQSYPEPVELLQGDDYATHEVLNKRQKRCGLILEKFWKRWRTEYLATLRERHKYQVKNSGVCKNIQLGEVVLIHDDNLVRTKWKMGIVTSLNQGPDLKVRSATLHTTNGEVTRSILHLYPLEIVSPLVVKENPEEVNIPIPRPKRQAADAARKAIALQARLC